MPLLLCYYDDSETTGEEIAISTHIQTKLSPDALLELVRERLEDDKAGDIVVIDLSGKSSIADYMVIASGQSTTQVGAMADHLLEMFRKNGLRGARVEGRSRSDWVLIDAGDVVVHLFRPEVREFYKLEKLWSHVLPETSEVASTLSVG